MGNFTNPFEYSNDIVFGNAETNDAFAFNTNVDFTNPFEYSTDVKFGSDEISVTSVYFDVVLKKTSINFSLSKKNDLTLDVVLPRVTSDIEFSKNRSLLLDITLAKPTLDVQLSRIFESNIDITLAKPTLDVQLSRIFKSNIDITLAKPTLDIQLSRIFKVSINPVLPKAILDCTVIYDNNVWRGLVHNSDQLHDESISLNQQLEKVVWGYTHLIDKNDRSIYQKAKELNAIDDSVFCQLNNTDCLKYSTYQKAKELNTTDGSVFCQLKVNDEYNQSQFESGIQLNSDINSRFIQYFINDRIYSIDFAELQKQHEHSNEDFSGKAKETDKENLFGWKWGKPLGSYSKETPPVVEPPIEEIYNQNIDFIFKFLFDNNIEFKRSTKKSIKFITKRFYYMLHNINVTRRMDSKTIHVNKIDITTDKDSWGWRFSFTVLGKQSFNDLKEFSPMELLITINNYTWVAVITEIKESASFGSNQFSASGYSLGVYLGEIYNPPTSFMDDNDRTIQQHINARLPNDWDESEFLSNYNWLVPANTYNYSNQTPIQTIIELAKISGNFVHNDKASKKIIIKPNYNVSPWDWQFTQPDIIIPSSAITRIDKTFYPGKNYNAVYVAGTNSNGVLGYVKRNGTAGDIIQDQPLTSSLITHNDGARAYGRDFLIQNLDKFIYTLEMPLNNDIPLVDLGTFLQANDTYETFKGISTDLNISVSLNNNSISVRQKISLEKF